ncbi:Inositol 2-dehydrogenase [Limihaloglobus sulfuriphilus]|uniref:Inositol 2-dehydrogenase n=1 Tax=Limihaloglobus sulfuriphilus TaxID=1851148 RepID=A0A1Q2MGY0_9BACT|nr:Gfo/Idh/MocA family oxidoreductase [Limihaloglobus sulfuriphilus]AQQ71567.1 Inositol 2-dehydrogenase [Limihaloglobus sulfuriphilus]
MRKKTTRRSFLKGSALTAASAVGFPFIVQSSALGLNGATAPSNRITVGCVGLNWMGMGNLGNCLGRKEVQVRALCDIDSNHLKKAHDTVKAKYGNDDCAAYHYFEELLARDDIDAVILSLPDHWHSIVSIRAMEAGKDVYGEKPLSHTLREGRAMCQAAKRYGTVWQTGSWQRSVPNFTQAVQIVRSGMIGKIQRVEVGLPSGFYESKDETPKEPPATLDYDRWLGPAPWAPYCEARCHINWRWHLDYGGGQLMDWVGHHIDIAHWGLDCDNTGPVEVSGTGEFPESGLWNAAKRYRCKAIYADGREFTIASGHSDIRSGTTWYGENGMWVYVNRGAIEANPKSLLDRKFGPDDTDVYVSTDHMGNFLECIKTRKKTITPIETAHRSASVGHLCQAAILTGRKIRFNPETEQILDDETANSMLGKAMRSPWRI